MRRILKSLFGGGAPATAEVINPGDQVVIADGRGTLGARGGRLSPRDQIDALQILSRLAQKESLPIVAVFEGEPLRKVADGQKFDDVVTVYYTTSEEGLREKLLQQVKEHRRKKPVLLTSDRKLEEQAQALGASVMRASTLVRALAAAGPEGGEFRGGEGRGEFRGEPREPREPRGEGREGRDGREGGRPQHPRGPRQGGRNDRRPPRAHPGDAGAPAPTPADGAAVPPSADVASAGGAPDAAPTDAPAPAPQRPQVQATPARRDGGVSELIDLV